MYVTVQELDDLRHQIEDELQVIAETILEGRRTTLLGSWLWAQVLKQATFNDPDERREGIGAVQVRIPSLSLEEPNNIWARPFRLQGTLIVPPKESWVLVSFLDGTPEHCRYIWGELFDGPVSFGTTEKNKEEIGFKPLDSVALGPGRIAPETVGEFLKRVREMPDKRKLISSDSDHVIFKDGDAKELRILADDDWQVHIAAGANGKIYIGSHDPSSGTPSGSPASGTEVEIEAGSSGKVSLKDADGNTLIELDASTPKITIECGGTTIEIDDAGKVTIDSADEVEILGTAIKLGSAPLGGVVTTLTDPLVDNITGAPHIGSAVVSAAS